MTTQVTRVYDTTLFQIHGNNGNSGKTAHVGAGQNLAQLFPSPMSNGNRNGNKALRNGNKLRRNIPLFPFGVTPVPVSVPVPGTDADHPGLRLFPLFPLFPSFGTHPSTASTTLPNTSKEKFVPDSATTETVTVPKSVLGPIISTYVRATEHNKTGLAADIKAALRTLFTPGLPAGDMPDTVRVNAEHAWHLAHNCDAMHVYGLDEEAEETYRHPAVAAQLALMKLVADQAPKTTTRLLAAAMQAEAAMQVRRR